MQDQATSQLLLTIIFTIGAVSGSDAYPVVISSFAGSVVFVMSATDIPILKRWVFFFISFLMGISLSKGVASFLSGILPFVESVDQAISAFFASTAIVRIAIGLSSDKDISTKLSKFFKKFGGD